MGHKKNKSDKFSVASSNCYALIFEFRSLTLPMVYYPVHYKRHTNTLCTYCKLFQKRQQIIQSQDDTQMDF